MPIRERIPLYKDVEAARGRPLIVYVTSSRPQALGAMASDAVPELLDQLTVAPSSDAVDLLVVSQGGDPTVAWRAMSLLRERFSKVAVLVPQAAFSAATLLALGADEIVMHPHGNLGPVDPQITVKRKLPGSEQETELRFGYEEMTGFLEFIKTQAGISDQQHVSNLFRLFCREVGSVPIGVAARGSLLSVSMGEKLLRMHMTSEADVTKARTIAETLNKKFFHHGYPVSRREAKEIGLKIADPNTKVEDLMWRIWLDVEGEFKTREPFNPAAEIFAIDPGSPIFASVSQVNIPGNLPPQLLQQVYQQILAQISLVQVNPVDFKLIHAVMESVRHASRFVADGKIMATRLPDLQIKINAVQTKLGWVREPIPAENEAEGGSSAK